MEYIFFLIIAVFFLFLIIKNETFKLNGIDENYVIYSYLLKLISGIALWYIYTYYYSDKTVNDIYKYFNDGNQLAKIFKNNISDFWSVISGLQLKNADNLRLLNQMKFWIKPNSYGFYNDNQTIIVLSCFLNLICNNNLLLAMLYMSIASFIALFILFKTLSVYLEWKKLFYVLLFVSPSIALWTNGLLKENLILLALTILVFFTNKLVNRINLFYVVGFVFGLLALTITKPYLFGFILPSVICFGFVICMKIKSIKLLFISMYITSILVFITWCYTHNPVIYNYANKSELEKSKEYDRVNQISYQKNVLGNNYNILEMLRFKQADYKHEAKIAKAKSLIYTKKLDGELYNFFICLPYGISNGFARPHIFEIKSLTYLVPSLENLFIIFLFVLIFLFPKKLNLDQKLLVFYYGTFISITFIFIGLLVPVLGNLVRYKAPFLPILFFCLLTIIDKEKIHLFILKIKQSIKLQSKL